MHPIKTLRPYIQAIPNIIIIQMVAATVCYVAYQLLEYLAGWTLALVGRVAITTGDFMFLFTTWQGILLMVLALVVFYVSFAFSVVLMMTFSSSWIEGNDCSIRQTLQQMVINLKGFVNPWGVLVILYICLLNPIIGIGLTVRLTEKWHIPAFISSVIDESWTLHYAYLFVIAVLMIVNFVLSFAVHGVVIDHLSIPESCKQSFELMKKNWKSYLLELLQFIVVTAALVLAVFALEFLLWVGVLALFIESVSERFLMLIFCQTALFNITMLMSLIPSLTILRSSELYKSFVAEEEVRAPIHKRRFHPILWACTALIAVGIVGFAYLCDQDFDELFPLSSDVGVVAHRIGGVESVENTVIALDAAERAGAWGSETDIQRTKDGYYIINHDDTFKRLCGVDRRPSSMTLDEIGELRVKNTSESGEPDQPVATYEELLDAARDRVILFVELKGATADRKMADDAVRIAREKGMLDQCVFISLKYDLIDYLELTYPEAETGFLAFASYGDISALHCDYLALEEQAATDNAIVAIHQMDKKVMVWTVNDPGSQYHFLLSDADAIITDRMTQAEDIREELLKRSDLARIVDGFFSSI